MSIAGDIGGRTVRLALVSPEARPVKVVAKMEFHSADYKGLQPIVEALLTSTAGHATVACFDVADPVIDGSAHLTNLLSAVPVDVITVSAALPGAAIYRLEQAILID